MRSPPPSAAFIRAVCGALRAAQRSLATRLWGTTAESIGSVADRFLDPSDRLRGRALAALRATTGLSRPMATLVLDGMARDWQTERLVAAVEAEPGLSPALDGLAPGPAGTLVRARGFPLTVHLGAGTVPGVCATSVIRGLLVKSAVFVKPGLGDVALTTLFVEALGEIDPVLGAAVTCLYWPGAETPEDLFRHSDLWVVYGGDRTVQEVRRRVPGHVPVVSYPHRLSLGVVTREALVRGEAEATAEAVARAASMYDQRGCVSPHVLFVEYGGPTDPYAWAALLAKALDRFARAVPLATPPPMEASRVQQLRAEAELRAGLDDRVRLMAAADLSWTVVVDPDAVPASCGLRTVLIRPVARAADAQALLTPFGSTLQTVGFAGPDSRKRALAESLSVLGVTRVCSFADQPFPPSWWLHDGARPLGSLVRWTVIE